MSKIFMIAGPNGAGKTTTARSLINTGMIDEFINADEIAKGLAPLHPESVSLTASKLMLKRFQELLHSRKNFAFETTGAGTNYLKHLKQAQKIGYEVSLLFLWLPNYKQAIERVAARVKQGGHNIPEDTIQRRYFAGLKNLFQYYLPLTDQALIVNNSASEVDNIIAIKLLNKDPMILNPVLWKNIQEVAHDEQK